MKDSRLKKGFRIAVELAAALAIVGIGSTLTGGHNEKLLFFLLLAMVVLLFSLKYGIYGGMVSFVAALGFELTYGYFRSEDVLLYFVSRDFMIETIFLMGCAAIPGVSSSTRRERHNDLLEKHSELAREKQDLSKTVDVLEKSRQELKAKLLENNSYLGTMYELFKEINHHHPEVVLDKALDAVVRQFGVKDAAIYYVDESKSILRLKVETSGRSGTYKTTIRGDKAPVLSKALVEEFPQFRSHEDPADAPFLVGPILVKEKVRFVLVARHLSFDTISSQQFELFVWFMKWIGERLEAADEWIEQSSSGSLYPGTRVYDASEVPRLVEIYESRRERYGIPYSCRTIRAEHLSVLDVHEVIGHQLRELNQLDIVAFDHQQKVVYLLLPNTEEAEADLVLNRVREGIKHWKEGILI